MPAAVQVEYNRMSPTTQLIPVVSVFQIPNATTATMPTAGIRDFHRRVSAYMKGASTSTHTYARSYHIAEVNHWLAMRDVGWLNGRKNVQIADVRT